MDFTAITKDTNWLDRINTAFTNLATVTKMVTHTDGITFKNGAIGSGANYSIGTYGKLRILTFDAGVKGINMDGSGAVTFASIPTSAYAGTDKIISTVGDIHHNGMGGYVMISVNSDNGDITATAITSGGRALAPDLIWSGAVTVLMEVA